MRTKFHAPWIWLVCATIIGSMTLIATGRAVAEEPNSQSIIDALKPPEAIRSLSVQSSEPPEAKQNRQFIDELRERPATRGITIEDRSKVAAIAEESAEHRYRDLF